MFDLILKGLTVTPPKSEQLVSWLVNVIKSGGRIATERKRKQQTEKKTEQQEERLAEKVENINTFCLSCSPPASLNNLAATCLHQGNVSGFIPLLQ